jgi:polysaccharide transporter, PST family
VSVALGEQPLLEAEPVAAVRADTLAASVVILLLMTLAQRLIGFGRGIMFCRWLEPEQLGQWDVAFGFLNLAAPLAVFGLPGSFGRYVEYFRSRDQFHPFLIRTSAVSIAMSLASAALIIVERRWFSELIFGTEDDTALVVWLAICLAIVILHNSLTALFIAVRRYRVVTALQFVQSLAFAAISLALLAAWPVGAAGAIIGYAAATVLSACGSVAWLRELTAGERKTAASISHASFWAKLAPFALWMWITNILANLFEVIDRFMIVHCSGMESNEALRQVGYYHSSRIVPLLFVAVAGLLGAMITPHLSHDWEAGRREAVVRRLNMVLKLLLLSTFAGSVAVLFAAPWLFQVAFQNKFQGGLEVLPLTLAYCTWFGTIAVAQNYLWCAERPGLNTLSLSAGLLLNIALNFLLLPRYGLEGAVWATTLANLLALVLIYACSRRHGMRVDSGTWLLSFAPAALWIGPWFSLGVLASIGALVVAGEYVLLRDEKRHVFTSLAHGWEQLKSHLSKLPLVAIPPLADESVPTFNSHFEEVL